MKPEGKGEYAKVPGFSGKFAVFLWVVFLVAVAFALASLIGVHRGILQLGRLPGQ